MPSLANISEFRSVFDKYSGAQRLNRFRIMMPVPQSMQAARSINNQQNSQTTMRYMQFFCNTADLPGVALATHPIVRYGYGVAEKKPVFPLFNDLMLTFYGDKNAINLQYFHDWMNSIVNYRFDRTINDYVVVNGTRTDIYELSYKEEYAVDAYITLLDMHDKPVYTLAMRDFFPAMIPETKFSWDPNPQIMQLVAMFTFTDWWNLDNPNIDAPQGTPNQSAPPANNTISALG